MIRVNERYYKPKGNKVLIANSKEYYGNYPLLPETIAILKRAEELHYTTPSFYQRVFMDLKIKAMKLSGVWEKLDIYYNFAYDNLELSNISLVDWKNPNRIATKSGNMIYKAQGWEGDAVNGYINTNYNPLGQGVNYNLNDASRGFVSCRVKTTGIYDDTAGDSIYNCFRNQNNVSQQRINQDANISLNGSIFLGNTGIKIINRTSFSKINIISEDSMVETTAEATSVFNREQFLFGNIQSYSNGGISSYFMGASLTFEESQQLRVIENNWFRLNNLPEIA